MLTIEGKLITMCIWFDQQLRLISSCSCCGKKTSKVNITTCF